MANISFEQLKQIYNKPGIKCGRIGYLFQPSHKEIKPFIRQKNIEKYKPIMKIKNKVYYNVKYINYELLEPEYYEQYINDRLVKLRCKLYSCCLCRPYLKSALHLKIIREVCQEELNYHLIVTFPGSWLRNITDYSKSYKILTNEFRKLLLLIIYELYKTEKGLRSYTNNPVLKPGYKVDLNKGLELKMIILPRAQSNPKPGNPIGFCHLHIITNLPLNIDFLEEKISKNDYKIGYQFIRENQSVAEYLCKDYFDDQEWYIPFELKHYRTTRNLHINPSITNKGSDELLFLTHDIKFIEKELLKKGYNLPFENQVRRFYDLTEIDNPIDNIVRNKTNYYDIIKELI